VTIYTWTYTAFALGRLTMIQEGTKMPTMIDYYEPSGLVKDIISPAPGASPATGTVTTHFDYDNLGNIIKITRPGHDNIDPTKATPIVTTINYTTDGTFTQPAAIGEPLTVTQPLTGTTNAVTHFRYNRRGDTISTTDANANMTSVIDDLADEPVNIVEPHTGESGAGCAYATLAYLYPGGPLTSASQYDESNNLVRQSLTTYDKEGQVLTRSAWTGGNNSDRVAAYSWDPLHRLLTVSDGKNQPTGYTYDDKTGYLTGITYPGGDGVQFTSFDLVGNPLTRVLGGVTTNLLYNDPDGLLSDIQPAGGPNINLAYDTYDRRSVMTDGTGSQSTAYDDLDEPLSVTTTYTGLAAKMISYGYFPDGSRASMGTPAGSFGYGYDLGSRMTTLMNPTSESSSWGYLNNGWLNTQQLGNGALTTYTENARGFTTALQNSAGGSNLSQFLAMAHDPVGNRTSMNSVISGVGAYSGVTNYAYDMKNQLGQEQSARLGGYTNPFAYDLAGNPTTFKGASHSFNSDNQDQAIAYNSSGNPTSRSGNALTFDPYNQLTVYGSVLSAGYTGDGLRAWKQTSAGRTYFLYDGATPVVEMNASGTVTATNTFGPNGLLSRNSGGSSIFYQFDPQGSVAQRLNSAGAVLSSDMYDAYGVGQSTGSPSDPWGYGAQWGYFTDRETGLLLLTHRYYDPSAGRFLNRDPIGAAGGINLYEYVGSNPPNGADPLGFGFTDMQGNPLNDHRTLWQKIKDTWQGYKDSVEAAVVQSYIEQQACLGRNVLADDFSDDPFLTGKMQEAFKNKQAFDEAGSLAEKFERGIKSPGLRSGTGSLGKGVIYLRGKSGVRIFLKQIGSNVYAIVGISVKSNEGAVIAYLSRLYGIR
ncbi:MAG: RHS repeat-associated core domain-containing protein, partial [Dehalococcoidia bacterium]